jgi:signal transduction histidine kinase/putative methionine-R-sulfoxide reductase with GAF domain
VSSPWQAVEAGTDLLARARQIQRGWDRLLGVGALGAELPPQATAGLRPAIVESWRRVLATGLDPTDLLPSIEADRSETQERWLEHPLGSLRHVLVEQLQTWAKESNSLVQVTDPSGLTLYLGGPDWLKEKAAEMNLVEGARCSETVNGTNGVGTALAADHPVQVFAFEHFSHHHREWVCSGAPIHDPVSGRLVGVIDLSSPWRIAHPRSLELVTAAASTTEQCLLEGRRDHDARLRRRYGDLTTKTTDLLVNREGYLLIGEDAGRPKPLDLPESGGEIAMDDGSLAVAEPLGQGEAYLVRRLAPRLPRAARAESLERPEKLARELATEQAALRQVATLVAYESSPDRLVAAIVEQVARVFGVPLVRLIRYEPNSSVVVGAFSETDGDPFPLGSRWQLDTPGLMATIRQTGRAARVENYAQTPGDGAAVARAAGVRSAVWSPIVVGGRVWGAIALLSPRRSPLPEDTEARLADFTELVATAIANAESRAAVKQLADEQAALRRVATLVARETAPDAVFGAVVREVGELLAADAAHLGRYDADGTVVSVAQWGAYGVPIGGRYPLDGDSVSARVARTGRTARMDGYERPGAIAATVRQIGIRSSIGVPISVQRRAWGVMIVSSNRSEPFPPETESRLEDFTELVATAISNASAHAEVRALADEQAALRRVATLVAKGASSHELFAAVTREAADVLDVPVVALQRYEPDRTFTMVSIAGETSFTVGSRWPVEDEGLAGMILATGRPARKQDYTTMPGPLGAALRDGGLISAVGVPIVVEGSIWGFMTAGARPGKLTSDDTEERLARFTELVATAIADSQAREQLAQLAGEQAALRRVATMVAQESPPAERFFSTVAREVASVLDVPGVIVTRYDADGMAVTLGEAFRPDLAGAEQFLGVGTQMPRDPGSLAAQVFDTHGPARVDDFSKLPGRVGDLARAARLGSGCAGPIVVNGAVWGKMCAFSRVGAPLPAGTENRLHDFIELVATAIANHEAHADLAASETRARELAEEQAALRRVATLVARGVSPEKIFSAVTNEMGRLFDSPAYVGRFEPDGSSMVVAGVSDGARGISIGSRWELEDYMPATLVYRTRGPVRLELSDFEHASGPTADRLRETGAVALVAAPIVVEGQLWGFVTVTFMKPLVAPDAEKRLEKFTKLLATAIANAESRAELAASRARIIAAADDARRRIERDLHDGAQQRLVTLTVALRRAEAKLPTGSDELRADLTRVAEGLTTAVDELRELSRGIHPSILSEGGLAPALKALGRRSPVRVKLDMAFEQRLPDQVEVAAYYTVSEALTNASKHANSTRVWVSLRIDDDKFLLAIRDDGVGGAHASRGSGLTGLRDRIEALGGTFRIESPTGRGTVIEVEIPIVGPAA